MFTTYIKRYFLEKKTLNKYMESYTAIKNIIIGGSYRTIRGERDTTNDIELSALQRCLNEKWSRDENVGPLINSLRIKFWLHSDQRTGQDTDHMKIYLDGIGNPSRDHVHVWVNRNVDGTIMYMFQTKINNVHQPRINSEEIGLSFSGTLSSGDCDTIYDIVKGQLVAIYNAHPNTPETVVQQTPTVEVDLGTQVTSPQQPTPFYSSPTPQQLYQPTPIYSSSPTPQQQQFYSSPTPQQQQFYSSPPPQQQQFYSSPPPQQQQFYSSSPPQQQQFYSSPPPRQEQFYSSSPPPQQQQFYSSPPPQQQQFYSSPTPFYPSPTPFYPSPTPQQFYQPTHQQSTGMEVDYGTQNTTGEQWYSQPQHLYRGFGGKKRLTLNYRI